MSEPDVLVACLCARWCGVCRDYAAVFEQVGARHANLRFRWVDVEDDADLVDPVEVEDFPTLLVAVNGQARFFGTITPQPALLERMVQERASEGDPALAAREDIHALARRLGAAGSAPD